MFFFPRVIIYLFFVLFISCNHKEVKNEPPKQIPAPTQEMKLKNFIEPLDSIITSNQIKAWFSCNSLLDSLTQRYADSFKVASPQQRIRYQEQFSTAQDNICEHSGLAGGYKEYKWILRNMGNPKNKQFIDSTGFKLSTADNFLESKSTPQVKIR